MTMWDFLNANATGIGILIGFIAALLFLAFIAKEVDK